MAHRSPRVLRIELTAADVGLVVEVLGEVASGDGRADQARRLAERLQRRLAGWAGGRQPVPRPPATKVRTLRKAGLTWPEVARQLGCSEWAARTALQPRLLKRKSARQR